MLSSQEVGTLITALGCGIGRGDDYSYEKLRYHRIVIMTDADVDGSHTNTVTDVLLPPIARTDRTWPHLHCAAAFVQSKEGKQERYVKDDAELNGYLLELALSEASLSTKTDGKKVAAEELAMLATEYNYSLVAMQVLSRQIDRSVLDQLLSVPSLEEDQLGDEDSVSAWAEQLHGALMKHTAAGNFYQQRIIQSEDGRYGVELERWLHGNQYMVKLDPSFFATSEYRVIGRLANRLHNMIGDGAVVKRGEKEFEVFSFPEVMDWLMKEARRGQTIHAIRDWVKRILINSGKPP